MSYKTLILFIAITAMFAACSDKFEMSDYVNWVENPENRLRTQHSTSSAEYILQYEPALYKALSTSENKSSEDLFSASRQFEDLHHFLLKIKTNEAAFNDEKAITQYLAYGLRKKIRFVEGSDTVKQTVMYHLESSGGITPYYRILVAFPKAAVKGNLQFIIEPGMFESDKLVFTFEKGIFNKLGTIKNRIE